MWTRLARGVSRRVNLAWWLETLLAPLIISSLAGACLLLFLRREFPATPSWQLAGGVAAVLTLVAGIVWLAARRRFETPDQSMVRIEAAMHLRNRLSAAKAGVIPWPDAPAEVDAGVRWNPKRFCIPTFLSLAVLAASLWIPLSSPASTKTPPEEPLSWQEIASDLDRFEQEQVVEKPYIEEVRKQLEELRSRDEEEWFSHSSLEASDELKRKHEAEKLRTERDLTRAEKALQGLQQKDASPAERERLQNEFEQAVQGLQQGAMKPNEKLLEQLKNMDPGQLGQLSKEQMQQLQDSLKKNAEGLCNKPGDGQGDEWLDELMSGDGQKGQGKGEGQGEGNGKDGEPGGDGLGKGGPGPGGGSDPDVLGERSKDVDPGKNEALQAKDLSRSLPGDLLELQDGEHDVDKTPTGPKAGGTAKDTGIGGDRVWRDSLDPSEQRALKRYSDTRKP